MADEQPPANVAAPSQPRAATPRRWPLVLIFIAVVLLLAAFAAYRFAGSDAALQYAIQQLAARTGQRVTTDNVTGSLLSSIHAGTIHYRDGDTVVRADDVDIEWSPWALLSKTVHIARIHVGNIDVNLPPADDQPLRLPSTLGLPMKVAIGHASIDAIAIARGDARWRVEGLAFGYEGGPAEQRLHDFALSAEPGQLTGAVSIAARPPFVIRGEVALTGNATLHRPVVNVTIGGTLEALEAKASGRVGEARLNASARVVPTSKAPLQSFALDVQMLDLHAIDATLPTSALNIILTGTGAGEGLVTGRFQATNDAAGAIDAGRIPLAKLGSAFRLTSERIALTDLKGTLGNGGSISGKGDLVLNHGVPGAAGNTWSLALRDVDLHAVHGVLIATQLSGTVRADVAGAHQRIVADVREPGKDRALAFDATVAGTTIDVARFSARAQGGELTGKGRFSWTGERPFTIDANATHLDPARFGHFPQASLDGSVNASGTLQPAWTINGQLMLAASARVRGAPVSGTVAGVFSQHQARDVALHLRLADATVDATGNIGRVGDRLQFNLNATKLETLAPVAGTHWPNGLGGSVHAKGHLDSPPSRLLGSTASRVPGISASRPSRSAGQRSAGAAEGAPGSAYTAFGLTIDAQVRDLTMAGVRVAAGTLGASVPPALLSSTAAWSTRPLTVALEATGLDVAEKHFRRVTAKFAGALDANTATLKVVGNDLDATASLQGSFASGALLGTGPLAWSGMLTAFDNQGAYPVHLLAPTHLDADASRFKVQDARIAVADGTLRVASFDWNDGRITTKGDFTALPIAAVARMAATELPLRTTLVMGGEWDIMANPRLNGSVHIRRQSGDLFMGSTQALGAGEIALGVSTLALDATLQDDAVSATATLHASRLGDVQATLALGRVAGASPGHFDARSPITASIHGTLASLEPLQPLLGTAALINGNLALDIAVNGTMDQPTASGTLIARNLRLDSPKYGLHWHDGNGVARIGNGAITLENVSFASGDGRFTVAGSVPLSDLRARTSDNALPTGRLAWHAQDFRATNRPDLRLVVSGDGSIAFEQGKLALAGDIRIQEGRIDFEQTPGATLSADVVIKGRPRVEARKGFDNLPLALNLHVDLGQKLRVSGQGLRATLQGDVRLTTSPLGALRVNGTVRTVDGTYLAFGQQLQIERGRVTFDGPIDNPALDIVALRKNLPVEAGVSISGTARLPQVQLTSNPPVPDGEKLSWLVLGQGLERSSGADLAALQAAAGALFSKSGPSFGTRIAQSVGLDDLALRSAAGGAGGTETQVLALSKRLSDRLYLIFEAGLSAASNALRIEYALTGTVSLRAQAGAVSSLGIYFLRSFE